MAENNPGQDNIAFDATTNQPRLKVDVTYDDKTSLDGIKAKYTDIGKQYNRFVTDARENVHDRQVEHIGNNFGASPYNTNTYYEPAATGFASAMRQQGTQQAFEVGMDRGKKEAEANLNAQKAAYENAATAYNNAYTQYQQTKSSPTMAPVDKSLLPGGVNEDEFLNYVKNAGTPAEGLQRAIDKLGLNNAGVKDWNDQDIVSKVKNELGENSDAWKAYAKHMEERGSNGVSERYADTELGRIWADTYAKNYFKTKYDDSYVAKWQTEYDKTRRLVNNIMGLRNGELHWTDTIVPTQDLPDNVPAWTDLKYIDIIQPEFKDIQDTSSNHVHYDNGTYTIDGRTYTEDEVRQKVANAKGTTVEELDKKFSPLQTTEFHNTSGVADWQDSKIKTNFTNRERWTPTTKEVWEAFAGGENAAKEYAGYTTVGLVSADDVAQAVLGVNIKEAKAVAQFKSENPDGYERLTDQMTRAYTDATVFEVADGKKAYHTRDGYKVLSAGTVVMNVPDAVLDENGEIFDEDLKRMKQLYQERDNGTVNQAKLAEEFEKAREAYAKRIMLARAVTNQTDGQIDKDIYSAILYSSDKKKYKDLKIGDKTAEELLNEFRDKVERKPEDAYREFSGLWELAYQNLGYFFSPTSDGYVAKKLYDKDGNSLVGRYGEDNKPKDKSSNYAMALVSLYANSMDAFTNGSKDGNIDPKFLKADGAEGILYNTIVGTGKILQGNAAFIAGAATGSAIGSAIAPGVGSLIGGLIGGIGGTVASVLTSDGKFHPGDIGYDADHNNNSSKLLRNAINPLSSALWGLDDSKPTRLGQTNDVSQGVEDFISGSASFMGELAIEAIITGMAGRFGEMARVGIQRGVGTAARNLLNAGQQFTIKSLADDVTRGVVKDLMDPSDEIAEDVANKYIKDVAKDKADDILGATTKKASTETSVIKGLYTVPSLDQLDDASRNIIGALNASANETTSKFMQIVSKLANNVDDLTDFSYKFAKNATRFITKESVIDSLAKAGYTGLDDATVNAALEYTRTQIAHLGGAAARQTYQTALISGFLGLAPEQVAKAPANVLTYLSKSIGQFYDNPSAFPGVFGAILEGEMSKDAIKRSFSEILEISAAAAQSGVKFSTDDVVRHLAASGWNKARLVQLTKNITLSRQGLLDDIFHDIVNGYTVPQMDEEGNYHQVTIDEYFASGQILSPFIMNGMQLAIGGVFRRIQSAAVRAKLDKANAALAATAMDSPDYAARYKTVQKYTAKAAKISDKLLDGNISYSKMKEVADRGMQYLKDADKKLFEGIERDIKAVDKNFSKKTRAQQAEFLKKRFKATDTLAQAYTNAQVGAFVKYPYFKKLLGGDVANTLATLEDRATISKIWDAMNDAAEKNRDAILGNKRLKGFWAKQAEMRKLQKEAAKEALRGPNGEVSVLNLESSLDSWFNMIDDVARRNVAEGVMTEDQLRLGYLPETGMLIGKPGDGVPAPARALWMGEDSGNAMAISSADPVMKREVYIKDLINAYKEGKTEVTLADGSTREFNPQGFSFLDAAIAYNNANTFHRTVGSIIGSGKKSAGAAAVQSGYVQFHGANASKAAAQADLDIINTNISKLEETAKKSMTEATKAEDIKTRERAKKALSDISKLENKIMETIGQQQVSAENLRKAADVLEQIATTGRRPAGAPSAKELLGIKDDSEAQKVFNAARQKVMQDIKKVQAGEDLGTNVHSGKTAPGLIGEKIVVSSGNRVDTVYEDMIRNAAKNNGHFDYDVVARRMLLDNQAYKSSADLYEVSTAGDKRFSALHAKLNKGTKVMGQDVGGMTIEEAYQKVMKKSGKNLAAAADSPIGEMIARGKAADLTTKTYSGKISPDENTVFVFGSNLEGRHGAGAAKFAKEHFGAVYGQSEGLQGNSYAIPTKDLRVKKDGGKRSVSPEKITESIKKMYEIAAENPNKQFKVAYASDNNLNGYSLKEMASMFRNAGSVPENVYFSKPMANLINRVNVDNAYYNAYKGLWGAWVEQNPKLAEELKTLAKDKQLNDKFAKTGNNQARALGELLGLDYKKIKEDGLKIIPNKKIDAKAEGKGMISNKYIGYGEPDSSTAAYAKQAGKMANTGEYYPGDVVFVSVQGAKDAGNAAALRAKTIKEALFAIDQGATIITDSANYIFGKNSYNIGEQQLYNAMREAGYHYQDITLPTGQKAGAWTHSSYEGELDIFKDQFTIKVGKKNLSLDELSNIDLDSPGVKNDVTRALTDMIANNADVASDRGLKEQYMRAVQDAFSQAKTIMNDQIKLEDIDMNEGGFSHGFFTYLDIVDRLLPDKDLYKTAIDTKLVNKLNNLGRDGITLSQLKKSLLNKIASEKTAGNSIDDLVTAYKVLGLAEDAGIRAVGTGKYEPGKLQDMLFEDDGSDAAATDYRLGVSDLYGNKVDTSDMYSQDFDPEGLMINRSKNPAQIDYDKLSAKDKSIYDMVRSGVDLSNKEELNEALKTTASVINKLTNNGSKLYDASLNAARKEASGVVEMAKTIREEINNAVNELAKKDKETKKLIEAEAARRSARQTKFNKTSTDNATYDGAAALGIARPQSAVLYSTNPAKYNAIAASLRNNEAGLANTVRAMNAAGVPDAQSILGYFREGRKGVEDLDSLINFDAGSNAGIYQQLKAATDYLKEKGVDIKNLDEKLSEMKSKIGNVNSYGDIYGNYNPPEYSLSAALAEVEGKTSFFPDNLRNGIDRLRTDEAGVNTWKAIQASDGISGLHDRFLNADKGMQKAMKKNGWDQINGVVVEYTGAGVSDSPESIIAAITSDASSAEQVFVHAVDPDGNTVDISKMPKDIREWLFDGLEIDAAGTRDKIKIYDDNGVIRAEEAIERGFERDSEPAFRDTGIDEKWASYLADTATKKSYKDMMADIETLRKKASRLDSKTEKLSNAKVDVDDGTGKIKQQSLKSVVEDAQDVNYKRYLSKEDYAKYQELKKSRGQINDYLNDKAEVYHALTGATFNGDAPGYSNMVRLSDFLKQYGYTPDAKELDASKFDAKKMGKELRKSNLATKKNWGSYRIDPTVLPSSMDKESAELTVANLLKFAKEAREATGLNYIDFDQMWVDKSYLELLARYSNRPLDARGLMGFAAKVSTFPNWVQQQQLAGGWGPINALTLAQVRSAILEDPAKAVAFAKMLADMRNSKAALNSIISRSDLLSRIALETGDGSIVTDLYPVMSRRAGRDDGGVIQTFANKILDRGNNAQAYSRFPKGFRANIKQDVEDFFETPTFAQAMPVLRAQMISMNYDSALSHLNKKFAKRIGKDISAEEIQNAAMQVAYARTQKFFTPQKYWNENYESGLQRIKNENIRKLVGQTTGEGTPTTILDVASNAFFALRYKQTFVNRFVQGFKEMASLPKMIKHQLSQSASLDDVTSDLTKVGQIRGAISLIGISVLAKIWCDALGIPNAWDDFDFNPEGDEVFHMPSVLMKFQNAGQIWMPNSGQLDLSKGVDWGHNVFGMSVDPNKQAYKIDPMFSMFTMPNTVFRAFNTAFNGGTDSYKAPQRGLPFLPTNGVINSMVNSNVGRALGDELIGSNLLSPFKALHEVITNSTYFGNNIWERKYLPDGSENPNYDPGRNAASSVMHLLGLDQVLDPNGYNRWVKGGNNRVKQDQVGTIAGSGILQHEYLTAAIHLLNGDIYEAAVEAGELPIKSQKLATGARTEMNTIVKNTLDHYGDEYREAIKHATSTEDKDKAYAEYMKKSADEVARWSKKYGYVLGKNQELVASMTRMLTAMTSGEYDDNMAYVQDTYWKASKIAQIESGANLFLKDSDLDDWLANGGTVESFAEEKERRSQAYNQALDDEYEARKALIDAKYKPEYLAGSSYEDLRAEQRAVSKKVYTAIMSKFEKQVGEFKNFKEMKSYYENMINSASTTKQKAKYAETYNGYVKEIIAAALADNKLDATVLNEATYNGKGLATQLSDYIIIPAGTYYTGKSPKTSYLKDLFEVGYKSRAKLPSDDEVREKWDTVKWLVSHGKPASAASVLEQTLRNVRNGSLYISDVDYSNMVRLQSKLRSKQ